LPAAQRSAASARPTYVEAARSPRVSIAVGMLADRLHRHPPLSQL